MALAVVTELGPDEVLMDLQVATAMVLTKRALPTGFLVWYGAAMSGSYTVTVGNKGRIVVPAEVRERAGLAEGTALVLLETPDGLALLTREQLRDRVRRELAGLDLVTELLSDRRRAAADEDAG